MGLIHKLFLCLQTSCCASVAGSHHSFLTRVPPTLGPKEEHCSLYHKITLSCNSPCSRLGTRSLYLPSIQVSPYLDNNLIFSPSLIPTCPLLLPPALCDSFSTGACFQCERWISAKQLAEQGNG